MNVKSALATVIALSALSLPVSASYVQVIDDFESGILSPSKWDIDLGDVANVDTYNAISARYDSGTDWALYYPPEGNWMAVVNAGDPVTKISTTFASSSGGRLSMQVFFSAIEFYQPAWGEKWSHNDFSEIRLDGAEIFFMDTPSADPFGEGMGNTGWLDVSVPLIAGRHLLEISVVNDQDFYDDSQLAVDNIRVTYATAPVPEPSMWAMMAVGLGLLGLTVGRRKELQRVAL